MKPGLAGYFYKYFYLIVFSVYIASIFLSLFICLIESFSYSGFFLKHINLKTDLIIYVAIANGFIISVVPVYKSIKSLWWTKLVEKSFLINAGVLIVLLLFTLALSGIESITYGNFIYSMIHIQPDLLYRLLALQAIATFVNLSLIVRGGTNKEKFISVNRIVFLRLRKSRKFSIANIQDVITVIYSVLVLVLVLVNSTGFVFKFYQPDKAFLKDYEVKYAFGKVSVSGWVDNFFPKTKSLIHWCDRQEKPVRLVTFDPQILWMDYEGMSRVYLTNCYFDNILSVSTIYSYIGKRDLFLVSISSCDKDLEKVGADAKMDKMEYLKVINNKYICNSELVTPGLYYYK